MNIVDPGGGGPGVAVSTGPVTAYHQVWIGKDFIRVPPCDIPKLPVVILVRSKGEIRKPRVPDTKQVNL